MAFNIERPKLDINELESLENKLRNNGLLIKYYVFPAITTKTDIECPICGKKIIVYECDHSYEITCETNNCIRSTFRGI